MLVLKHVEYPAHSQHWSELEIGTIHITNYHPEPLSTKEAHCITIKRKTALLMLRELLREGWIIMFNNLFEQSEL